MEEQTIADSFSQVTVLFADIVDFTPLSANLSPQDLVALLNEIFSLFDDLAEKHGLEKIKTIGDAYMVVGGLPEHKNDHAQAVAEMALDIQAAIASFSSEHRQTFEIRIGINTGPVVAGVIGTKKISLRSLGRHGQYCQPDGVPGYKGADSSYRNDLQSFEASI